MGSADGQGNLFVATRTAVFAVRAETDGVAANVP
jgi:hypothetical protein